MQKTSKWVYILLVAGVAIAAPRLAGAFGQLIGVDVLKELWWFARLEVYTGFALAILEGLALAHIAGEWKKFPTGSFYWAVLGIIQFVLLLALPFVSTVYLVASQFDEPARNVLTWRHLLNNHLVWIWSYLGAGISTIIVMAIGIVHNIDNRKGDDTTAADPREAILRALAQHGQMDPGSLAEITGVPAPIVVREMDALQAVFDTNGHGGANGKSKVK